MARGSVTVALSGDAGDELFGGYNRYLMAGQIWSRISNVPRPLRQAAASVMSRVKPQRWEWLYGAAKGMLSSRWQVSQPADKIHKLIELLGVRDAHGLYKDLVSQWKSPQSVVLDGGSPVSLLDVSGDVMSTLGFEQWMMFMDAQTYLPDDILVKMDRAAMSVSLETRIPLLDHRVVEFAARLPLDMKIRDGQGKWILRQILYRYVPRELIERPKTGFSIPLGHWMRGPLREWAEALISESRLKSEGFLDAGIVRQRWDEHMSGRRDWQYQLWNILMFQSWLEEFSRT
jgi:asparagine synthase (glutamine-hydrolysing)